MFKLFFSNQPIAAFGFPIVALLLTFIAWSGGMEFETSAGVLVYWKLETPQLIWAIIGFILLWFSSVYINRIFQRHEFHQRLSYLPGILFLFLFVGLSFKNMNVSLLLSMPFLLLGFDKILAVFRENVAKSPYFDAGFWIGMATICYTPNALFLIPLFGCINFTRTFNWREWFLALIGYLLPAFYFFVFIILWASPAFDWKLMLPPPRNIEYLGAASIALISVASIGAVAGLRYYLGSYSASNNRARNAKTEFLFFTFGFVLIVLVQYFISEPTWQLIAFSCSYFLTYLVADIPKKALRPLIFYVIILLSLATLLNNIQWIQL